MRWLRGRAWQRRRSILSTLDQRDFPRPAAGRPLSRVKTRCRPIGLLSMQEGNPMDQDREKVADIKAKVQHGRYEVDPTAVADALLRRLREDAQARAQWLRPIPDAVPNRRVRVDARIRKAIRPRP